MLVCLRYAVAETKRSCDDTGNHVQFAKVILLLLPIILDNPNMAVSGGLLVLLPHLGDMWLLTVASLVMASSRRNVDSWRGCIAGCGTRIGRSIFAVHAVRQCTTCVLVGVLPLDADVAVSIGGVRLRKSCRWVLDIVLFSAPTTSSSPMVRPCGRLEAQGD